MWIQFTISLSLSSITQNYVPHSAVFLLLPDPTLSFRNRLGQGSSLRQNISSINLLPAFKFESIQSNRVLTGVKSPGSYRVHVHAFVSYT